MLVGKELEELIQVVETLMGPDGCPWDREQTHASLKKYLLEEAYEYFDAVDANDLDRMKEELGDVLLQPLMHAEIAKNEGSFTLEEVAAAIKDKLIRRHPHVFGDRSVADADEVLKNWDQIKKSEKPQSDASILDGIPKGMPSLLRALQVSKRAARAGFEWPNKQSVLEKLDEEVSELKEAIDSGDKDAIESEIGDLLFTIVNVARWEKLDGEDALHRMLNRFQTRFKSMESQADKPLSELSPIEWDDLWNASKAIEKLASS